MHHAASNLKCRGCSTDKWKRRTRRTVRRLRLCQQPYSLGPADHKHSLRHLQRPVRRFHQERQWSYTCNSQQRQLAYRQSAQQQQPAQDSGNQRPHRPGVRQVPTVPNDAHRQRVRRKGCRPLLQLAWQFRFIRLRAWRDSLPMVNRAGDRLPLRSAAQSSCLHIPGRFIRAGAA